MVHYRIHFVIYKVLIANNNKIKLEGLKLEFWNMVTPRVTAPDPQAHATRVGVPDAEKN